MKHRSLSWRWLLIIALGLGIFACQDAGEAEPGPTRTPRPVTNPGSDGDRWLVMFYFDADDEILEEDMFIDLNEAELVGSTERVMAVAQMDRYDGGFDGDGDWTSTKRFELTQDGDMEHLASEEVQDLGEANMGDPKTLVDFASWAIKKYPADHYVLILSDHGAGWTGGWSDDDPEEGSELRMQDIDAALGKILSRTGIGQFELVGFDACLMGQLEVFSSVAPHARYAVGSEEVEPSLGWAYAEILWSLNNDPEMNGRKLAQVIVDSYIAQDGRITDDAARLAFIEAMGIDEEVSADELAEEMGADITLTAVDLSKMQDLNEAFNELAALLTTAKARRVARARTYAQSYESVFGEDYPPSYIDLGHFGELLSEGLDDPDVDDAVKALNTALKRAVVAEKHGENRPGSTGISIYFPNSKLYKLTASRRSNLQYTAYVGRFATASLWDDFLAYHYADKDFDPDTADLSVLEPAGSAREDFSKAVAASEPDPNAEIVGPGAGVITIAPIEVSAEEIPADGTVTLSTQVQGENISYIYYYVSYYSEEDDSYLTADMGYIQADETKEIAGIYYPDWEEDGTIDVEFDWEPTVYFMSDGDDENAQEDQFAFFEPEVYGISYEQDVYTVQGRYTFADGGEPIDAEMSFSGDGRLLDVYGFTGEDGTGAPWQILPQPGDQFTIYEEWLEFEQNPEGEFVDYEGGTLVFGENRDFLMVPYTAYVGEYIVGIIVEDMNGNINQEFVTINVTE